MSSSFRSYNDSLFDIDELLQTGTMCSEGLEFDIKSLLEARTEDKKYIQGLEREIKNCSQEIEYLQDQLNLRNIEANCLGEHVHSLELKLAEVENLHEKTLREELVKSESERLFLIRELENKEAELQNSNLCIEKLEESISSTALEYQCDLESMKLDLMALEQRCFEAKKFQDEAVQEKEKINGLLEEFEIQFQNAQKMIEFLERENKELKVRLGTSDQKVNEHLGEWPESKDISHSNIQSSWSKLETQLPVSKEMGTCEEDLGPLLSKLAVVAASDEDLKDEMEKMSHQIHEYELLVKQLKEELRGEKFKAKEEAEDLTQEMAELRYQITDMLEQECKRRACIEQVSLKRIAELEAQVQKEQRKSFIATMHFHEAQKLAESRSMEVCHLKKALEGLHTSTQRNEGCSCGDCPISTSVSIACSTKESIKAEASELGSTDEGTLCRAAITWHPMEIKVLQK